MTASCPWVRAHCTASRTIRLAYPFPRCSGSVNIESRYGTVRLCTIGLGWRGIIQRHPLATASPGGASRMNPTRVPDRSRGRAHLRYVRSPASSCCSLK